MVKSSACNFYDGVSQKDVEDYYASIKDVNDDEPLSYGLNTDIMKDGGIIKENIWNANGKYSIAIKKLCSGLAKLMS